MADLTNDKCPKIGEDIPLAVVTEPDEDDDGVLKSVEVGLGREVYLGIDGALARYSLSALGVKCLIIVGFDALGQANGVTISISEKSRDGQPMRDCEFNLSRRSSG